MCAIFSGITSLGVMACIGFVLNRSRSPTGGCHVGCCKISIVLSINVLFSCTVADYKNIDINFITVTIVPGSSSPVVRGCEIELRSRDAVNHVDRVMCEAVCVG